MGKISVLQSSRVTTWKTGRDVKKTLGEAGAVV